MTPSQPRLEAISDGIFAFAATLVVVGLDVPDTYAALHDSMAEIFSFAVSFAALVLLWVTHHNFFRRTRTVDGWVVAYNFAMLFVMLCYVFPLKFLAKLTFGDATISSLAEMRELFLIYSLGFGVLFLFVALLYRRAARQEPSRADYLHYWKRHFLLFTAVGFLSVCLAYMGWGMRYGVPGLAYFLLGPLCGLHGWKFGQDDPEKKQPTAQ